MKRWSVFVLVVSSCATASNARVVQTTSDRGGESQSTAALVRPSECASTPSRSLPDPPPEYVGTLCWTNAVTAGRSLDACDPSMARIEGGDLRVLEPQHARRTVKIEPFCIERNEVTVDQWRACVRAGRCAGTVESVEAVRMEPSQRELYSRFCNARYSDRGSHPINCVSWLQAMDYCAWRYGAHGTLPSEDQWAFAARGTTERVYPWGDDLPGFSQANRCSVNCMRALGRVRPDYTVDSEGDGWVTTAPVGSFPRGASVFAVNDLAGNVAEWTRTVYGQHRYDSEQVLRYRTEDATLRVWRGGSWAHVEETPLQIDSREWLRFTDRSMLVGFRCVREGGEGAAVRGTVAGN